MEWARMHACSLTRSGDDKFNTVIMNRPKKEPRDSECRAGARGGLVESSRR